MATKFFSDHLIDCGSEVKAIEFAPNYKIPNMIGETTNLLAVGLREGGIKIYNVHTGELLIATVSNNFFHLVPTKRNHCKGNILGLIMFSGCQPVLCQGFPSGT